MVVFFIKSGKVAFIIPDCNNFPFLKIKQGYYFGEIDLLFHGEIRKHTTVALKECEFYVLNKKDFKKVFIQEFRDVGLEIARVALERKKRTKVLF